MGLGGKGKNRRKPDVQRTPEQLKAAAGRLASRLVKLATALVMAAGLMVAGYYAWTWATTAPAFALTQITFRGLTRANSAELTRLSGLALGQNLFALEAGSLEKAMAAHPWVKSVELARHLPSTVEIRVAEHHPVAITTLGDLYLVDDAGEPFKKVQAEDGVDLPLVTGIEREEYVARPAQTAERLARALRLAQAYGELDRAAGSALSEVRLGQGRVTLVTGEGQEVLLPEQAPADQLPKLARIQAELDRRGLVAEVIHLDNRARPGWVSVRVSAPRSERTGGPGK